MISLCGRRILVVEGQSAAATHLEGLLRELGCSVPGRTGKAGDALAIMETDRQGFDAATLDCGLDGNGFAQVAAALDLQGTPFLVTSGSEAAAARECMEGRPVLIKPFLLDDLREALTSLAMDARRLVPIRSFLHA